MSVAEAINEIKNGAGTQFDPAVVNAFLKTGEMAARRAQSL
jgi:HD-GYP domain-containing protein (c-di-GMP phosphodiesterase class II)